MDELSCEVVQNLLPSYADGLTGPVVAQAVKAHLDSCPSCRESFDRMTRQFPSMPAYDQKKAVAYLRRKRRFALLCRALLILAGAAVLGWLIYLGVTAWLFAHGKPLRYPQEFPLAAPAVYAKDVKLSCTRETSLSFPETSPPGAEGTKVVEIRDRYVIRNDGDREADCLLAIPNVMQYGSAVEADFHVTMDGAVYRGWYGCGNGNTELYEQEKLLSGAYLNSILPDWDGLSLPDSEERFGTPEDLTGSLLFLADASASAFVNGVVLPVDGAFSAYSGV